MSTGERTGWRDQEISARHRLWGAACTAADLDPLLVEYNLGKPVALVEYKRYTAQPPDLRHPTYRAIAELADDAAIPFLLVNALAEATYTDGHMLTERGFVDSLYKLRGRLIEREVFGRLNTRLPLRQIAATG